MHPLTFDRDSYLANGERIFLISGEMHYFRTPRAGWRDRLEKLKAAGGNCVATYVPWLLHEPAEGTFDFSTPQYDFELFLELCNEVGLWALVRPGPYQYSELAYCGLPGWLCENYPELRAKTIDGKDIGLMSISYLHPLFLEKTRRWYAQVVPRLARHQTSHGGAVAAVQFDNELMGIHYWFSGGWDYNTRTMGIGREDGRWPEFLRTKYGTPAAAGAAYGIEAANWAEILPIANVGSGAAGERRRVRDYQDCYFASIAEYGALLTEWLRAEGIDTPVVHNSANPGMNAYFREMVERLGNDFLLGSDHYYTLNMDWEQNNPTPKWACSNYYSLEMLRLMGKPPTVYEMPGGSASDYPPFTAHDAACAYMTNVAYGVKGWNYYIFAGGYNPPGAGTTSDVYDYGAALSPTGEIRALYYAQQAVARLLVEQNWLASARRVADCRLGLSWEYPRAKAYANDRQGELLFSETEAWTLFCKGMLMTAHCAGLSPEITDLTSDTLLTQTELPLMVACGASLPRDAQQQLVRFLDAGGKLLLAPLVPTLDEEFAPCTLLADYLGGVAQTPHAPSMPRLHAFEVCNVSVNGSLFATTQRPAGARVTAMETSREAVEIGWRLALPSGGVISVLGMQWMQAMREHEAMLTRALIDLGADPCVRCDNPNIWTVLRSDGQRSMLFLLNLFSAPMTARVEFRDPITGARLDTGVHVLPGISVTAWMDGRVVYPVPSP